MGSAEPAAPGSLIAVVGATGTGKSETALRIAERVQAAGGEAEIVGADAMQLYRGMDIGTAKLPVAERRGIAHHLIDVLDVTEEASVAWYQPIARSTIDAIIAGGRVPILVGGSGLYVSAVAYDFRFPHRDEALRAELESELERRGSRALYRRLAELDSVTAEKIDPANGRRVVRALELEAAGAQGYGATLPEEPVPWRPLHVLGLSVARPRLVARLDERVEAMWRDGLVDEVAGLVDAGIERGVTASRAIGYAQALAELHGRLSRPEAIAETQARTRRYARRQVSWFKRYPAVDWVDADDGTALGAAVDRALDSLDGW